MGSRKHASNVFGVVIPSIFLQRNLSGCLKGHCWEIVGLRICQSDRLWPVIVVFCYEDFMNDAMQSL